jgi:hypothetical protein
MRILLLGGKAGWVTWMRRHQLIRFGNAISKYFINPTLCTIIRISDLSPRLVIPVSLLCDRPQLIQGRFAHSSNFDV